MIPDKEEHAKHKAPSKGTKHTILLLLRRIGQLLYSVLCIIVGLIAWLARKSRVALVVILVVLVLLIVGLVDFESNAGKIYEGVSIGDVDVSHMTADEAADAISERYSERLQDASVIVFANEEVASSADLDHEIVQYQALAEQMSVEEAQENKILWIEDASALGAFVPVDSLVNEALSVGREGVGINDRLSARFNGHNIDIEVDFDEDELESFAADLDASVGTPHLDYSIEVNDGVATVTDGYDGDEVDRDWLRAQLAASYLDTGDGEDSFVVETVPTPVVIDEQKAQTTCDAVNVLISQGTQFIYNDKTLDIAREQLGSWVSTRIEETDTGIMLAPYIDEMRAASTLVSLVSNEERGSDIVVSMTVEDNEVMVIPQEEITVPLLADALSDLDEELFGEYRASSSDDDLTAVDHVIDVDTTQVSEPMSFNEAYMYGVITEVSSFTTEYVNVSSTANRVHNIHLAADLLNNSVAPANGGTWSFNDIAGPCDEEAGFLDAGAISEGEYIQDAGGGICQVATTVFNAVFDAGYAVVQRTNHSLYVSSYPAGRDAAIAYPDLNLVWRNDSASDVLLCTNYTDTTITVTLYGVDPGYVVSSETGDWIKGESYSTKTVTDDELASGSSYVMTAGSDGLQITVWRTVRDREGDAIYEDVFSSTYSPVTEVIVEGTG